MSKRCIFCKRDSSGSKSIEHVLPESLGNEQHTLPPGTVCDSCNNYFASNIERPVLEAGHFTTAMFNSLIPNKRAKMPVLPGMLLPVMRQQGKLRPFRAEVTRNRSGDLYMYAEDEAEWGIASGQITRLIIPASGEKPDRRLFARFLAKVGVECMALQLMENAPDMLPEFIDDTQISVLSGYARFGKSGLEWPYSERRIYTPDQLFREAGEEYEVLHEWTFLHTDQGEMYFVMAILGAEYAMNMGGPDVEGYEAWVRENRGRSPLYDESWESLSQV
jgi:hypothetical protein